MLDLKILLLYGPSASGKSFLTERVLGIEYDVTTAKLDKVYYRALRAAGVPPDKGRRWSVFRNAEKLRNGGFDSETVVRFRDCLRAELRANIERAKQWNMALVLEGYTLRYEDEVTLIAELADEVSVGASELWRVQVRPPYKEWNTFRATKRSAKGRDLPPDAPSQRYEQKMAPARPVAGVTDRVVSNAQELRGLLDDEVKVRRHKWYQSFELGPISTKGPSDAREKIGVVLDRDLNGKSVLDICSATGVHSFIARHRGARTVVGVEHEARKYGKALELAKTLNRHSTIDVGRVQFKLGDALGIVPTLDEFDTVLFFGAIHYFPDYGSLLHKIAAKTRQAAYIEFTFSEREHDTSDAPGYIRAWVRRSGNTIYMGDRDTIEGVIGMAMPDFTIEGRTPISAPARNSDREVWCVRRRSGTDETASSG